LKPTIVLSDGRTIESETAAGVYSSCEHPDAEGIIGSPVRVRMHFPGLQESAGAAIGRPQPVAGYTTEL